MTKFAIGLAITLACALAALGYVLTRPAPEPEVRTEIVYRDRTLTARDTVRQVVPETRILYRTEVRVDTVRVLVPTSLASAGRFYIAPTRPLSFAGRTATVTLFDPAQQRWEQQAYRVPRPRWGYSLSLTLTDDLLLSGLQPAASILARVRYRRLGVLIAPSVAISDTRTLTASARVGITITLASR